MHELPEYYYERETCSDCGDPHYKLDYVGDRLFCPSCFEEAFLSEDHDCGAGPEDGCNHASHKGKDEQYDDRGGS